MTAEAVRVKLRDDYLAAFRDANSESPPPVLVYERGWWSFYSGPTAHSRPFRKIRTPELEGMLYRLRNRIGSSDTGGGGC